MRRTQFACLLALAAAAPASADETTGRILAYDRLANVLVMADRTVWTLPADLLVPADMEAGDRVRMVYGTAGEDGVTRMNSLTRIDG